MRRLLVGLALLPLFLVTCACAARSVSENGRDPPASREPKEETNASGQKVRVHPWVPVGKGTRTAYAALRAGGEKGDFRAFRWSHPAKGLLVTARGVTVQKRDAKGKPFKSILDFSVGGIYYWHTKSCVMDIDGDGVDEVLICKTYGTSALPTLDVFRFARGKAVRLHRRSFLFRHIKWGDVNGDGSRELVLREELDRHKELYGFYFVVGYVSEGRVGSKFDAEYSALYQREEKRLLQLAARTKNKGTKLDCLLAVARKNRLMSMWCGLKSAECWELAARVEDESGGQHFAGQFRERAAGIRTCCEILKDPLWLPLAEYERIRARLRKRDEAQK